MQAPAMLRWAAAVAVAALLAAAPAAAFYLPGVAPNDFQKKDPLLVKVNKLTSTKTQLPYSYYSLPFCKPNTIVDSAENLGEVLRGDRIENSPYVFEMREPKMCQVVCKTTINEKQTKEIKEKIEDEYRVNMILDNLPLVVPIARQDKDAVVYQGGYHVGVKGQYAGNKDEKYFIHNHLTFLVKYHKDETTELSRIVGFEVKPYSSLLPYMSLVNFWCQYNHQFEGVWNDKKTRLTTCDPHANKVVINSDTPQEVEAGKEIIFTYDVSFEESEIKWASRWDTYLLMTDDQIHWFSIVNSLMIVLFLSGMVAMIMLRTLYRDIARYNQLETEEEAQEETGWKLVHGDVFRPPTNSDLLCVYVGTGVQFFVPLVFVGSYLGFKQPAIEAPVKTNKIPRQIPEQAWYMNPAFTILIGGILPFGAVFIELFFILTSIWLHQFYYIFGFLFLVFIILIVTCAEITIVLCYFQLCSEDYMWWWRSYLTSGSSAIYLFLYAGFYFFTKLQITKFVSGVLYFGYMLLASYAFFVLTGTIGFCACFWFTRLIYSSVKID
ncbi:hypothetical protein PR202_ga21733 [Eleusine coracana subsp. coracana]|uniref:Transmembrane 9 superfamily member n=1 Tax=Eleusine coracana subsp. coracana TaxID=191504 RepID=A0AAV5D2A2_ELECO|nr:hypothetical protein PR202_ga21733 [Eleusine coracana subsp. coracana]